VIVSAWRLGRRRGETLTTRAEANKRQGTDVPVVHSVIRERGNDEREKGYETRMIRYKNLNGKSAHAHTSDKMARVNAAFLFIDAFLVRSFWRTWPTEKFRKRLTKTLNTTSIFECIAWKKNNTNIFI
jgi:hypothetical protein